MDLQVFVRNRTTTFTGRSFLARVLGGALAVIFALVILVVAIPLLALAALIGLAVIGASAVRRLGVNLTARREERHNVRVRN